MPDHKQSFLTTILALVTAFAAVVGAIGGLIATIYATDGRDAASTATPAPALSSTTSAVVTPTPSPAATPRLGTPTPAVIEFAAEADSSWGPPATSGDEEGDSRGEDDALILDWGCSDDSRGNGSKRDCGSGTVALQFDLSDLPAGLTIDEAVLRLYEANGSGTETMVYARHVTSGWEEDGSDAPDCDSTDETAAEVTEDEWAWDLTEIVRDQYAGEENSVGVCFSSTRTPPQFSSAAKAPSPGRRLSRSPTAGPTGILEYPLIFHSCQLHFAAVL